MAGDLTILSDQDFDGKDELVTRHSKNLQTLIPVAADNSFLATSVGMFSYPGYSGRYDSIRKLKDIVWIDEVRSNTYIVEEDCQDPESGTYTCSRETTTNYYDLRYSKADSSLKKGVSYCQDAPAPHHCGEFPSSLPSGGVVPIRPAAVAMDEDGDGIDRLENIGVFWGEGSNLIGVADLRGGWPSTRAPFGQ